jgi:NADH-quinone oxidoreductase subunit M
VLEALLLAVLSARAPWALIALLAASAVPLVFELRANRASARVLAVHVGASMALLCAGQVLVAGGVPGSARTVLGFALVASGIAVRSGLVPAQCWVGDLFENASFGTALVSTLPLSAVYAAARLLVPSAPVDVLRALAALALATAVYAACMSAVQTDARRFLCHVVLTHSSLVLAGVALVSPLGTTAGLCLWLSVPPAVLGLGLTLRSVEARTGRLSLVEFQGLHAAMPRLAALLLVLGLATVGFPGTFGFFGTEMLTDAAGRVSKPLGVAVVVAAAIGSIAVVRAWALLFLGARHRATVDLRTRPAEIAALLALVLVLVGGTVWPQPAIDSRAEAATALVGAQSDKGPNPGGPHPVE